MVTQQLAHVTHEPFPMAMQELVCSLQAGAMAVQEVACARKNSSMVARQLSHSFLDRV